MQIELTVCFLSWFYPKDNGELSMHRVVRTVYRMVAAMATLN